MHLYMYVCIYITLCVCVYIHICMCVYITVCMCVYITVYDKTQFFQSSGCVGTAIWMHYMDAI